VSITGPTRPIRSATVLVWDLHCTRCAEDMLEAVQAVDGLRSAKLDYRHPLPRQRAAVS
jgi:hypothetical protein